MSLRGLVTRTQSGFYAVNTDKGTYVCQLRGRLKKGQRLGDVVANGDWVQITPIDDENGVIDSVEPRARLYSRMAPRPKGEYEQILIANPDQVALVFACAQPEPRFGMLDRFLVIAEKQAIPALIIANKIDLVGEENAQELFGHYSKLGYEVVYTSALTKGGMDLLQERISNKISLFTGPSGAGKTSLLNIFQPGLGLRVRQVSQATSKGKHTTVVRQLFPLGGGGYVADTPGIKALAFWDIEPEEIDGYFPEMCDLVADCQFSDCTHVHEPGCAVLEAVQMGQIHSRRYQSYLSMRFGEEE